MWDSKGIYRLRWLTYVNRGKWYSTPFRKAGLFLRQRLFSEKRNVSENQKRQQHLTNIIILQPHSEQNYNLAALVSKFWIACFLVCTLLMRCGSKKVVVNIRFLYHQKWARKNLLLSKIHYIKSKIHYQIDSCVTCKKAYRLRRGQNINK